MTFDDLEQSLHALLHNTCVFGARDANLNEERPILSGQDVVNEL